MDNFSSHSVTAGMNKPGGAAWVLSVNHHPADPTAGIEATVYYDVKYVLNGNSDVSVHCSFVSPVLELCRGSRKRGLDPGPSPVSIPASVLGVQAKGRRKIAVSKSVKGNGKECIKQKSIDSEESHRDTSVSGCSSSCTSKGSDRKVLPMDGVSEHSSLTKIKKNKRNSSALTEDRERARERERDVCLPSPVSGSAPSSQPVRSVCISHTSLENTDVMKLEKFIQKFSSLLHDHSCPSSSSSSSISSSSSSSTPRPVPPPEDVGRKTLQSTCILTDNFDSTITHLIVSVDKKGLLKKRTLKFMQAIMGTIILISIPFLPFFSLLVCCCYFNACLHLS